MLIWNKKPVDLRDLPTNYWSAQVTNAYALPLIGEALNCSSGPDDYNRFRVFDVQHQIGGGLAELFTEDRDRLIESKSPEGERGLVTILAYRE